MVGGTFPLGLDTLQLMGMVIRRGSRWVLTPNSTEQPVEGGEAEDDESDDESDNESSLLLTTKPTSPSDRAEAPP